MAKPSLPRNIEAQIQGEISGQVAIGNNIIQIGAIHGGVVNIVQPEQQPRPQPRPSPVFLRPRPFPGLLDREAEVGTATAALQSATPVEFHGQAGLGKTTLLRHLAYHPIATSFPDGVVYLSARHQPVDDLLQSLFDAFYESDASFKPTDTQVRHALQGKQALILLDDVELARGEVETLMDAAPGCTFLLASPERRLWGEGHAVALHGLPPDDAQALVERELGRPLTLEEQTTVQALCTALECHPLHLLQAAAMAREEGRSLTEVARRAQTPSAAEALTAETLNALPKPERQVLAALAALGDAPLHTEHLAALTGLADAAPVLEALQRRGLVEAHSPRYSLTGALGEYLQQVWDLTPWAERVLAYFTTWAEGHRSAPARLLEEADAILRTLEWATGAGRWMEALRLGWAVEGALALGKRWGAWAQVLQWALEAARAMGDRAAEAWTLHQLGSRALCLGDAAAARTSLSQALRMREAIGDRAGAAVTRHNLNLLLGAPPAPPRKPPPPKAGPSPAAWLTLAAGTVIAASLLIGIVIVVITPTPTPPPPPPPTNTPTSTPTPTRTPTPTVHPCAPGVFYCEDFEDGQADGWELGSGWRVEREDSNYVLSGRGHNWSTLAGYEWDDYRVRFRLKLLQGSIHLNYRLTEGPIRYFIGFHQGGLYLSRQVRDTFTDLATVEASHQLNRWYEVEIVGWGGHLQVYVDGKLELDYTDKDPLRRGGIAFETLDDSYAQVDDIEVMGAGPEPTRPTSTPTLTPTTPPPPPPTATSTNTPTPTNTSTPTPVVLYDFVEMAPKAQWTGYAPSGPTWYSLAPSGPTWYSLKFSGKDTDPQGFALWRYNATLEDGSRPSARVLETHPTWVNNGEIRGKYSLIAPIPITFQQGDRFVARAGFLKGATQGTVTFKVSFRSGDPDSSPVILSSMTDLYDNKVKDWTVLLDVLAGESGYFYLIVDADSTSTQDWAVWVKARLERP